MIWLLLAALVVCSGCVSASETALFSLSRQTISEFRQSKNVLHRRVIRLMHAPRAVLMTVLICNTGINVAIFSISFLASRDLSHSNPGFTAGVGVATLLTVIIFGELLPKAIALANARVAAPAAGALISTMHAVLAPMRLILGAMIVEPLTRLAAPALRQPDEVTTDELQLLVEHSARDGHINSTENELLQSVVALDDVSVREVMTPRVDMVFCARTQTREHVNAIIAEHALQRLVICGRNHDDIFGVLDARQFLLNPQTPWFKLVTPVKFVPEQSNLLQALRQLRGVAARLLVVVDEYGGTAGLVTLRSVTRWIVGHAPELPGRKDEADTERIDANTYSISADLSARVWADRFGVREVDRNISTVGGLVLSRLGRVPHDGDRVRVRNLTLTVESMRGRRIHRLRLSRDTITSDTGRHDA